MKQQQHTNTYYKKIESQLEKNQQSQRNRAKTIFGTTNIPRGDPRAHACVHVSKPVDARATHRRPNTSLPAVSRRRALLLSERARDRSSMGSGGITRDYAGATVGDHLTHIQKLYIEKFLCCWNGLVKTSRSVKKNNLFGINCYLKNVLKVWFFTCSRLNDSLIVWYDVVTRVERWTCDCEKSIGCGSHPVIGMLFRCWFIVRVRNKGMGPLWFQ